MIGFFLKKAFFDGWDNLITLAILNIGFIILLLAFLTIPRFLISIPAGAIAVIVVLIYLLHMYAGGVSVFTLDLIGGKAPELRQLVPAVISMWKVSFIFGTISSFQSIVLIVGFPFYLTMGGLVGLTAASILFWFSIFWWFVTLWLFPVKAQLDNSIKGIIKKSLFICFDNPGFTLFLGIYTVFNVILSGITAFLIPGMSAVLLSHQIALKLRMYKYEYIEKNPGKSRKSIPWDALLIDEREKTGQRTLKGMIFPWKE